MYIKSIAIQGFTSYKDQSYIEQFSPHHNIIVGQNGAGKSNFFKAIEFVLSDRFSNLRGSERQSLLHEGAGRGVMSAFVEILFDNSDGRFPVEKPEVTIRRTIGLKKDEYRVDNKTVTQREVINMLETAGFSRSNPYYIVQQGKVQLLTTMKDSDRLNLLMEVAGTKVYDDRRQESVKIMAESDAKQKKIVEVINSIEERLKDLEREKNELAEYQRLDKERRSLEYTIYNNDLNDTVAQLARLEADRANEHANTTNLHNELILAHERVKDIEKEMRALRQTVADLKKEQDQIDEERQDLIRKRAQLELEIKDIEDRVAYEESSHEENEAALKQVSQRIAEITTEIERELDPKLEALRNQQRDVERRIAQVESRVRELYAKQGLKQQFGSKQDRDRWINQELDKMRRTIRSDESKIETLQKEIVDLRVNIDRHKKDIADKNESTETKKAQIDRYNAEYTEIKKRRDEQTNQRKHYWKEQSDIERELQKCRETELDNVRKLESTYSKAISRGLSDVKRIVSEQRIEGVHGPLIELFDLKEENGVDYRTAVEVTAGNSLFHVVVDTDATASKIIEHMNKLKDAGGRITFMPLNRLRPPTVQLPENEEVSPIINKLRFHPNFTKAFQQVFGKTLVATTLPLASQYSKQYDVNCVTINGDRVDRKGALTGGFIDDRMSRLGLMKNIKESRAKRRELEANKAKINALLDETDQVINQILDEMQKKESEREKTKNALTQEREEVRLLSMRLKSEESLLAQKEKSLESLQMNIAKLRDTVRSLEAELAAPFVVEELSDAEHRELNDLNTQIVELKKSQSTITAQKVETETRKQTLQNTLFLNLEKRAAELRERLEAVTSAELPTHLEALKQRMEELQKQLDEATARREEIEKQSTASNNRLTDLKRELDEQKAHENACITRLQARTTSMDKLLNKKVILTHKKEECIRKIRDLGTLPSDYQKYKDTPMQELMDELHDTHEKLKQYEHVNKKALDQYNQSKEQREALRKRKKELDEGAKAINNLIKHLDQRKDEAIMRTFKQVASNFTEIFAELVPGGKASMVMKRAREEEEEEGARPTGVLNYVGVAIKVSFGAGEEQLMQQLSGGQKSLVALALIFAIQRCDPAPFYLFDEIDAALDQTYRTAVAAMIQKLAKDAQFITATFKKEMVDHGDKFFQIQFKHKVSSIRSVPKEVALEVINEVQRQEEAAIHNQEIEVELEEGEELAAEGEADEEGEEIQVGSAHEIPDSEL